MWSKALCTVVLETLDGRREPDRIEELDSGVSSLNFETFYLVSLQKHHVFFLWSNSKKLNSHASSRNLA